MQAGLGRPHELTKVGISLEFWDEPSLPDRPSNSRNNNIKIIIIKHSVVCLELRIYINKICRKKNYCFIVTTSISVNYNLTKHIFKTI